MDSISEIRHHISAVEQTKKITNAMEKVSSARMKKFAAQIPYNTEYFQEMQSIMKDILLSSTEIQHPYMAERPGSRRTFLVIAGDKGMAGSYNANILNMAYEAISQCEDYHLITVGVLAAAFFRKKGIEPELDAVALPKTHLCAMRCNWQPH